MHELWACFWSCAFDADYGQERIVERKVPLCQISHVKWLNFQFHDSDMCSVCLVSDSRQPFYIDSCWRTLHIQKKLSEHSWSSQDKIIEIYILSK